MRCLSRLLRMLSSGFQHYTEHRCPTSHPHRPMRPNEVEGRDYFFVDRPKFEGWIRDDMLLEHANVYGDYKGIPRQQVKSRALGASRHSVKIGWLFHELLTSQQCLFATGNAP
eukprot:scaffold271876_cov18-Tisochrysis_lutea.AAC.5